MSLFCWEDYRFDDQLGTIQSPQGRAHLSPEASAVLAVLLYQRGRPVCRVDLEFLAWGSHRARVEAIHNVELELNMVLHRLGVQSGLQSLPGDRIGFDPGSVQILEVPGFAMPADDVLFNVYSGIREHVPRRGPFRQIPRLAAPMISMLSCVWAYGMWGIG